MYIRNISLKKIWLTFAWFDITRPRCFRWAYNLLKPYPFKSSFPTDEVYNKFGVWQIYLNVIYLIGKAGPQGSKGDNGLQGAFGEKGEPGTTGRKWDMGQQGTKGEQG